MKKQILFFVCLLLASVSSMAGGVEIDGINYEFNSETKTASVVSGEYSGAVTIPSSVNYNREEFSVTSIGDNAFSGCNNLTTITLGKGIGGIGQGAFSNCPNLTDVYCYAENVPAVETTDVFQESLIEYATLHVPVGSIDAYKAAEPWSGFKDIVAIAATAQRAGTMISLNKQK